MTNDLWPYAEVPGFPKLFVCGCFERWVSIHLQAIRGFNLAWGLVHEKGLRGSACVVGGGFAGLACAAGLGRLGVKVTLVERNRELLATQRQNRVRFIHPHLHQWPRPGCLERRAELPMLGWSAGRSDVMAKEVLDGFDAEVKRSNLSLRLGASVTLEALRDFDATVLALGVGIEKSFGALPLRSYWADEDIATVRPGPARHHLVTGIGEGGVIDTLYLVLRDFSHVELAERFARVDAMRAVEAALLELERSVEGLDDATANARLTEAARHLSVPREVDDLLRERLRTDTRVTLNGPEPFPLAPRADLFNRFLLGRLLALGAVTYRPGKVRDITAAPAGAGWRVTLEDGDTIACDEVNVRHGTVPSLKAAFPEVWAAYHPVRAALPHLVPEPRWPAGAFD